MNGLQAIHKWWQGLRSTASQLAEKVSFRIRVCLQAYRKSLKMRPAFSAEAASSRQEMTFSAASSAAPYIVFRNLPQGREAMPFQNSCARSSSASHGNPAIDSAKTHCSSRPNRAQRAVAVDILNVDAVVAAAIIFPGYCRRPRPNYIGR